MGYQFGQMRVLIVDDNAHARTLVIAILRGFGIYRIVEAANGDRAWTILNEYKPNICVLDWMMEGMSGLELVRKIRTDPMSPDPFLPVIMLTGRTSMNEVHEARDAGVNEFIAKPVSVKAMTQRLQAVIDNPRPFLRAQGYVGPCRRRRGSAYEGSERRKHVAALVNRLK